jgi:hypothetical protein
VVPSVPLPYSPCASLVVAFVVAFPLVVSLVAFPFVEPHNFHLFFEIVLVGVPYELQSK